MDIYNGGTLAVENLDPSQTPEKTWHKVCIQGVGLLGGSIAMAIKQRYPSARIVGWGRSLEKLKAALDAGAIDEGMLDLSQAAEEADLVIAATPVQQIVDCLAEAAQFATPDCLFLDVGSTKASIAAAAENLSFANRFCPSHPIAGSEKSGVEAARQDLLLGKLVVLTPTKKTAASTTHLATQFWQSIGAKTLTMSPVQHDAALAMTSHMPHLIASALSASMPPDCLPLVGSGWADLTRVAAGDPTLWRQIVEENAIDTYQAMQSFATIWQALMDATKRGDFKFIEQTLLQGKQIRDAVGNRHPSG